MSKILYKGGSLSSTYKLTSPEKVVVVKQVSRRLEREYGFVRFYSQLKKHIRLYSLYPELFPEVLNVCLLYTSPSPRDRTRSRMPSSA